MISPQFQHISYMTWSSDRVLSSADPSRVFVRLIVVKGIYTLVSIGILLLGGKFRNSLSRTDLPT